MKFKNEFERRCFGAVRDVLGDAASLEHNKVLVADFTPSKGIISFTGPPKKEIDIIVARLSETLTLLISVKDYASPAAPLAVQEWAAVTKTMNEHSGSQSYLGLVVCSSGFTEGCPAWAMDYNIGLVPPFKGRPIHYGKDTVVEMLKRSVLALKRLSLSEDLRLSDHKNLFWEVYKCLSEFPEPPGK